MDWKGLLNWTLKYQDGTVNKDLKPMSEEDRKFIEDAYESVCINEMKEIWKRLDKLKEPEGDSEEDINLRCETLEDLIVLVDGPENARNIVRGKRFNEIVSYFFSTKHKSIKLLLASLLATMMQNDKIIQAAAIDFGIFKVLGLLNSNEDRDLSAKYIYLLTGLLYGDSEKSKSIFIQEFDGVKLLHNILIKNKPGENGASFPTFKRALGIIKELTKIEDKEAENFKIRKLCLGKMGEIKLQLLLLDFLSEMDYSTNDNIDITKLILEILSHSSKLFEKLDPVLKLIGELNAKMSNSEILTKEEITEEKAFIIGILKTLKAEFIKVEEEETKQMPLMIGSIDDGSKPSIHIELKK